MGPRPSQAAIRTLVRKAQSGFGRVQARYGPNKAPNWSEPARSVPRLQGSSVAISADGNTIIEGGPDDNGNIGAAWVFIRQAALPGTPAPATILLTLTGLAALALLFRSLSRVT